MSRYIETILHLDNCFYSVLDSEPGLQVVDRPFVKYKRNYKSQEAIGFPLLLEQ